MKPMKTTDSIAILQNIDANIKSLLDIFSAGITGVFAKTQIKLQKKTKRMVGETIQEAVSSAIEETVSGSVDASDSGRKPTRQRAVPKVPQIIEKPEKLNTLPSPSAVEPVLAAPKPIETTIPSTKPTRQRAVPKQHTDVDQQPKVSKSQQALIESKQKSQDNSSQEEMQKQVSILGKFLKPMAEAVKDQFAGKSADIKDTAGLAAGGPFYAAAQELSGLGSEMKDVFDNVREKTSRYLETGETKGDKNKPGRDAQGRYIGKDRAEKENVKTNAEVIAQSNDKTVSATHNVETAIEKTEKADQKRHRELIRALLSDEHGKVDIQKPAKQSTKPASTKPKTTSSFAKLTQIPSIFPQAEGKSGGIFGSIGSLLGDMGTGVGIGAMGKTLLKGIGSKSGLILKGLGKAAAPLLVADTVADIISGYTNTSEIKKIFDTKSPTKGQRIANSAANVLDMGGITTMFSDMLGMGMTKEDVAKALFGTADFIGKKVLPAKPMEIASNTMTDSGSFDDAGMPTLFEFLGAPKRPPKSVPMAQGHKTDAKINPKPYIPDAMTSGHETLGSLAAKYESGGKAPGVGAVSSGSDAGGVSYGMFQMASKPGKGAKTSTVSDFVNKSTWSDEFKGLEPGSPEFSAKWKQIASQNPEEFSAAQSQYIKSNQYDPMMDQLKKTGIDLSDRPKAVQEVLMSRAIQHGAGGASRVVMKAIGDQDPTTISNEDLINRIYDESAKKDAFGNLAYFKNNPSAIQASVDKRLNVNERKDALAALEIEEPQKVSDISQTQKPSVAAITAANITPKTIESPKDIQPPAQPDGQAIFAANQAMLEKQMAYFSKLGGGDGRATPPSQPQAPGYNIPMEFDDALLTLMVYDRV